MVKKNRARGFTLLELLVVVAVIGILAVIAVPNFLNAIARGKQKRTMADLRALGTAIETYRIDSSIYPTASDVSTLRTILEGPYVRHMPSSDGWGKDIVADATPTLYTIGSEGKDGAGGLTACAGAPRCTAFDDAIILVNGQFIQYPDGVQQ